MRDVYIYREDAFDEWVNGAYDEYGNQAVCDICGGDLKFDPERKIWFCKECGNEFDRRLYFNHIGADPEHVECLQSCSENYPLCRQFCDKFIFA